MKDLEKKRYIILILAVQFALWGLIGLDIIGFNLPILRQIIGSFYITFIPGFLILRVLKVHNLDNIENILYMVGLSIATLMFTGLVMNIVYPYFGIIKPISIMPLIITLSFIVLALCIVIYSRDGEASKPNSFDFKNVFSQQALFLYTIPLLSIFGAYFANLYNNNIVILFLFIIVAIVVLLIGFTKFIPNKLYPLTVFVIAISLLFHRSLITMYLTGWDIFHEYYLSNLVLTESLWDPTISYSTNAMLSIVMLAPIYSIISNINIISVFKIIYPLLFSLVPLGLYRIFQKQTNDKIAFLSCFFFMSFFTFYTEMIALARQQIAELFLVLIILLILDQNIENIQRSIMLIIFGFSLVTSHYGLSYVFILVLIPAWLILLLFENPDIQKLLSNIYKIRGGFNFKSNEYKNNKSISNIILRKRKISSIYVILFITFVLTWYINFSNSSAFYTIVELGNHITNSLFKEIINPEVVEGLKVMNTETNTLLQHINKGINYLNQIFIMIGFIILLKPYKTKFEKEYVAFSVIQLIILFGIVTVPYFGSALNTARLYHISLIFLAPFGLIGGIIVISTIFEGVKLSWTDKSLRRSLKVLSVYFVVFFLYQTGFIFQIVDGTSGSISLNYEMDYIRFNPQEVLGAMWLKDVGSNDQMYADEYRIYPLSSFDWGRVNTLPADPNKNSYIYLGTLNVNEKKILVSSGARRYVDSEYIIKDRNKIYSNGGAEVYYS